MYRLLILLILFALTLGNGAAMAAAICQHQDARAHAAALHSSDTAVAAAALSEDRAATAEKEGTVSDGASASLLGYVLPSEPELALRGAERENLPKTAARRLSGRSPPPLLEPPLV